MELQLFFTLQVKLKIGNKSVTLGGIPVKIASIPSAIQEMRWGSIIVYYSSVAKVELTDFQ